LAEIEGQCLTTFEVAPDGRHCRLNFTDAEGRPAALTLPTECLNELMMTLPRIVSQSLRARYQDSSLRLVFPAAEWRLESTGTRRVILTIGMGDGFEASFAFERTQLREIGNRLSDDEAADASMRHSLN
jgi:hypothetical protein